MQVWLGESRKVKAVLEIRHRLLWSGHIYWFLHSSGVQEVDGTSEVKISGKAQPL